MEILVVIIAWLLFGGASSYFAKGRGRDPFAWFLIGMLLGILGLLLLFLLPPLTRESLQEEASKEEAVPKAMERDHSSFKLKAWYYLNAQREQIGPTTFNQLRRDKGAGKFTSDTLLWCEGMSEWKSLQELPEIQEAL